MPTPASIDAPLTIGFDVPVPIPTKEIGYGRHIRPKDLDWTLSNIVTTKDWRAYLCDSYQKDPSWKTTTSGDNARRRLSDFTAYKSDLVTSGGWDEVETHAAGDYWLSAQETGGKLVTTGGSWSGGSAGLFRANPHLHLSLFAFGIPDTNAEILRIDWGNDKWRLSVYGNGGAALLRDQGSGLATVMTGTFFAKGNILHEYLDFRILPLFRRAVYMYASGTELAYEDYGLDPTVEDYTAPAAASPLVAAGTVTITAYTRLKLQLTEVKYKSGQLDGTLTLPYPPTESLQYVKWDGATSLHWLDQPNGSTVAVTAPGFTPDGSTKDLPLRAVLTPSTDKLSTPVLYALGVRFDPVAETKAATRSEMLDITLSDSGWSVAAEKSTATLVLKEASDFRELLNRHLLIKCGDDEIFLGHSSVPSTPEEDFRYLAAFDCDDLWKRADKTPVPSMWDFSGMLVTDGVKAALTLLGLSASNWEIGTSTRLLPKKDSNGQGGDQDPLLVPARGRMVGDLLRHLNTYLRSWFMDWAPSGTPGSRTVKFRFLDPLTISETPVVTLYRTMAEAHTAGKDERYVVQKWRQRVAEPEATRVTVYGQAPGGKVLTARFADYRAEDGTLAEADRPANWVGEVWEAEIEDTTLSTIEAVNLRCREEADLITKAYLEGSFESEWHPPVRRWDWIEISGDDAQWRVVAFDVQPEREAEWAGRRVRNMVWSVKRVKT